MQRKTSLFASSLAAMVAVAALQAPAHASTPAPDAAQPVAAESDRGHKRGGKHHRAGHHQQRAALVVPGYGGVSQQFVDTLALTDAQKGLLEQAQQARTSAWSDHSSGFKADRAERRAALAAGTVDPRAALKAHDVKRAEMMRLRATLNEKWLAVWDALDDAQRSKIAAHLASQADSTSRR